MSPGTLRTWVRRDQVNHGTRVGLTTDERARLKPLERENRDLGGERTLKDASIFFVTAPRSNEEVVRYIDSRRERWEVEPICKALQFAPATYYAIRARPESARAPS